MGCGGPRQLGTEKLSTLADYGRAVNVQALFRPPWSFFKWYLRRNYLWKDYFNPSLYISTGSPGDAEEELHVVTIYENERRGAGKKNADTYPGWRCSRPLRTRRLPRRLPSIRYIAIITQSLEEIFPRRQETLNVDVDDFRSLIHSRRCPNIINKIKSSSSMDLSYSWQSISRYGKKLDFSSILDSVSTHSGDWEGVCWEGAERHREWSWSASGASRWVEN